MEKTKGPFPHVFPNIEDWNIYKLHEDRSSFIKEINEDTFNKFKDRPTEFISKLIAKTVYLERIRIKEEPWKVDPPDDKMFWSKLSKELVTESIDSNEEEAKKINEALLKRIINRYSEEIVASFKPKTFKFARKFLTFFFNRLLNTAASRNFGRLFNRKHRLQNKFKIFGEIETLRELYKLGTVVIVPTHFSNLDSILIGYTMDQYVGVPFPTYGAGLNLYNSGYTAYYMNRLGAHRVDRRKKNPIYLETLKSMSCLATQKGTTSLFFPGGTRSRSGALEERLKMGLIGTTTVAQRVNYEKGDDTKVFIVPLVLGYNFVLEAKFMIDQHLRKTGKEMYFRSKDESYSFKKVLKFAWETFSESSDIMLSFGQPMDVMGNRVDEKGNSYADDGRLVDLKEYFYTDGKVVKNNQRERQYTKRLAEKIAERFQKDNIVLSSHLVAFAVFKLLINRNPNLDIYATLRLPPEDYIFSFDKLCKVVDQMRSKLYDLELSGDIKLQESISADIEKLVKTGIRELGTYHGDRPLKIDKNGNVVSEDFKVLYYYHNRLDSYQLENAVEWKAIKEII